MSSSAAPLTPLRYADWAGRGCAVLARPPRRGGVGVDVEERNRRRCVGRGLEEVRCPKRKSRVHRREGMGRVVLDGIGATDAEQRDIDLLLGEDRLGHVGDRWIRRRVS